MMKSIQNNLRLTRLAALVVGVVLVAQASFLASSEVVRAASVAKMAAEGTSRTIQSTGTIEGRITLQGRKHHAGITLRANGAPVGTTDATGAFSLTVAAGYYTVQASHPGYVSIKVTGVSVPAGRTVRLPTTSLLGGDTNNDGNVDLYDVVRCVINFRRAASPEDPHIDVNGDGIIDVREIILTQQNYRRSSPAAWH